MMLLSLTEQESLELAKRLQEDNYPGIPWEEPMPLHPGGVILAIEDRIKPDKGSSTKFQTLLLVKSYIYNNFTKKVKI